MASDTNKEVLIDLSPVIKLYKDGTVERLIDSPYVPPSPDDAATGVVSKDLNITPVVQARLYLPTLTEPKQKLPVLVYYHGGGFCIGSAFNSLEKRYISMLAAEAKALIVSVEYRLAPQHPLPIAYEDSWTGLQWVSSHVTEKPGIEKEPWLTEHSDFSKIYIGGDSAGGNIVHNILLRAGAEPLPGDVKIVGAFLSHPYFWGSKPIGSETKEEIEQNVACKMWLFAYPSAPGGIDNAMINPFVEDAPSLSGLGCSRLLVCVAEKDPFRSRGVLYVETVKKSGWNGEVEMVEVEGEDHCFHMFNPETEKAKDLIKRLASFISY
ncbi:2-hydroxyisoflavanone dehydratase-like isoform X3 [Olea europaea var. sylvestris]|uniref:2-hydroxyisoflavanone dehydratase-like isoform X1 n=1 Tax=Olea europaea var. sylvestris TaxID=158386 RepID=UPI000C1D6737|nr:2-hydroxyisoflavanone dehydratase-like isoform X1 [Olea europaea var. sylvestris]XP_022861623.1 2-hydroxyisoflavanone dehydratase-like isoform X2 [Olea europaea var. sylvestris]XP_022861624.1 2-hydroxyisoflavanone dehydratase-like isoform X3 [Olea europaea var. sylvestris]